MIAKAHISKNMRELDAAYRASTDPKTSLYFAKLAILELCGWIELSMDDLIESHARRHIRETKNKKYVNDDIIKKNYGFDYDRNFRHMMMRTIGIVACENIEIQIGPAVLAPFEAQLSNLKLSRNGLAHTFVKGTTLIVDAPSVTRARVDDLYVGLKAFETKLRAL